MKKYVVSSFSRNSDSITTDIIGVTSHKRTALDLFDSEVESLKAEYGCNFENEDKNGYLDRYWYKGNNHFEFNARDSLYQCCIDMTETPELLG